MTNMDFSEACLLVAAIIITAPMAIIWMLAAAIGEICKLLPERLERRYEINNEMCSMCHYQATTECAEHKGEGYKCEM